MVITKNKDYNEILKSLGNNKNIIILGCSECASVCKTGGEDQVVDLKKYLETNNKNVQNTKVLSTSCNFLLSKKELKELKDDLTNCDVVISMSCGNGVQTVSDILNQQVVPANDTLFVGEKIRSGIFEENCRTCGECLLGRTAAICPVTRCAKGLLNGPCGGAKYGKCEVNEENDCAWIEIYNRLLELDKVELLEEVYPIRSYSESSSKRSINNRRKK